MPTSRFNKVDLPRHPQALLPPEVWEMVFDYMDVVDLAHLKQVCLTFSNIISRLLNGHTDMLLANGLVDCVWFSMPLSGRRQMLRRYHHAWEHLSCPLPQPVLGNVVYTSMTGYTFFGDSPDFLRPQFLGTAWMSTASVLGDLTFYGLPAISTGAPALGMCMPLLTGGLQASQLPPYVAYRFDPSQDLLILVGPSGGDDDQMFHPNIYVRRMSTGQQHAQARRPLLLKSPTGFREVCSFRICGDLCAIIGRTEPNHMRYSRVLNVWNWKTGQLLYQYADLEVWGDVISFLDSRTLLVVDEETLLLLTFDENENVHFCLLSIPSFHQDALQIWTTVSQPHTDATAVRGRAFIPEPTTEVVVINFNRTLPCEGSNFRASVLLAIRVDELLKFARASIRPTDPDSDSEEQDASDDESVCDYTFPNPWLWGRCVAWEAWGPASSRFFEVPPSCDAPGTYGRRFAVPVSTCAFSTPMLAMIEMGWDAPPPPQVHAPVAAAPEWSTAVRPAGEVWDSRHWFQDPQHRYIRSDVPCRVWCRNLPWLPPPPALLTSAMLWENGIVLKMTNRSRIEVEQGTYIAMPFIL